MSIRLLYRLIVVALAISIFHPVASSAQSTQQLVILNWDEYVDPEVIARFETKYAAKVVQVFYTSDETRTEKLLETDGHGYDLIMTAEIDVDLYSKRGWLAPIDENRLPNLKHIAPRWRQVHSGAEHYAVPFSWGTTGIVYRADLLKTPITSWRQFFAPAAELQGRISMTGDSRDLISMGLKALGYSANSEDPEQLKEVEQLLLEQQPYVRSYEYLSVNDSALIKGEVVAAIVYNGDALMMKEHNDQAIYVLPKEGGAIWTDCFVLGANGKNPELTYAFLNFINEPDNAAQLAQYAYFATTNQAAEKLLPEDFLNDPVIYPDQESLKNSEFFRPLSARSQRQRNAIAARIVR